MCTCMYIYICICMLPGPCPRPPPPAHPPTAPGPHPQPSPTLPAVPHNRNEPTQTRGREDDRVGTGHQLQGEKRNIKFSSMATST